MSRVTLDMQMRDKKDGFYILNVYTLYISKTSNLYRVRMAILQIIKKRNGEIVPFEADKIETVIKKAFVSVTRDEKATVAKHIAELVSKELELEAITREGYVPTVEHTQDLVEKHIMAAGFFDVAKAYIIYRYERSKEREEVKLETLEKVEEGGLFVTKKSGVKQKFDIKKVKNSIARVVRSSSFSARETPIAIRIQNP